MGRSGMLTKVPHCGLFTGQWSLGGQSLRRKQRVFSCHKSQFR